MIHSTCAPKIPAPQTYPVLSNFNFVCWARTACSKFPSHSKINSCLWATLKESSTSPKHLLPLNCHSTAVFLPPRSLTVGQGSPPRKVLGPPSSRWKTESLPWTENSSDNFKGSYFSAYDTLCYLSQLERMPHVCYEPNTPHASLISSAI